jgi:glycosyltransferase involved in cell wall biosynthesis
MLYFRDHLLHPIIMRQLGTLRKSGRYTVTVIDCPDAASTEPLSYRHLNVQRAAVSLLNRYLWWLLKCVLSPSRAHRYWIMVSFLGDLITAGRFVLPAFHVKADLYHAHDLEVLPAALLVGWLRRRPVLYDAHEMFSDRGPVGLQGHIPFLRWLEKLTIPRADLLLAPNRSRAEIYAREFRLKRPPVVVLNCPPSADSPKTDLLKHEVGLPPESRVVLCHGSMIPGRSLPTLVRASAYFDPGSWLVLMGSENDYYNCEIAPLLEQYPYATRVRFLGYVPHEMVMPYVAGADLGIVIYEPINRNNYYCAPTKLYEFVMARVPVAVARLPELEGFLDEFPAGILVESLSPDGIAAAVNCFFAQSEGQHQAMAAVLERARASLSWEAQETLYLGAYEFLLQNRQRADD